MKRKSLFVSSVCLCCTLVFEADAQRSKRPQPQKPKQPATAVPLEEKPQTPIPPEPQLPPAPAYDVPELPVQLDFATTPPMAEGDQWTYLISSADPLLDGKSLRVALKTRSSSKLVFTVERDNAEPATVEMPWDGSCCFSPNEEKPGLFLHRLLGEKMKDFPGSVSRTGTREFSVGGQWSENYVTGKRTVSPGWRVRVDGPYMCVVPAGTFACARLEYNHDAGTSLVAYHAPASPAPVRVRILRSLPEGIDLPPVARGWILLELSSYKSSGQQHEATLPDLPAAERNKAIEWIKKTANVGGDSYTVGNFLFLLHDNARRNPRGRFIISIGSGMTKDKKGYVCEWQWGKFTVREMTPEEMTKASPNSMTRTVLP
jgi:hypothetical protein